MCREIRALREGLPKESVCVFVGAALPRASGITKIHVSVRRQGEGFVVREIIPDTGHFPYAENPSAFFQRIEEWLHRLPFSKLVE
jgi:pimeloyl-ACP methyl ester carboxylesterase